MRRNKKIQSLIAVALATAVMVTMMPMTATALSKKAIKKVTSKHMSFLAQTAGRMMIPGRALQEEE